jgi:hypothetical protein
MIRLVDQQSALYASTEARLIARLGMLRAERSRMKWLGIATIVAAFGARFFGLTATIIAAIFGGSLFFVGHYVVYAHIYETKLELAQIRKTLRALRLG